MKVEIDMTGCQPTNDIAFALEVYASRIVDDNPQAHVVKTGLNFAAAELALLRRWAAITVEKLPPEDTVTLQNYLRTAVIQYTDPSVPKPLH